MDVKIDFQLGRQFGVVERIIFRLVLNGFTDAREIADALPVFSEIVLANGIKRLVNQQILAADVERGALSVSEAILALIEMCLDKRYTVDVPASLTASISNGGLLLESGRDAETVRVKEAILKALLPDVNLQLYRDTLDFVISGCNSGSMPVV